MKNKNCPLHDLDFPKNCIGGLKDGYRYHTEVRCQKCNKSWLWGISWNQDKEKDFVCSSCEKCEAENCHAKATHFKQYSGDPSKLVNLCVDHYSELVEEQYSKWAEIEEARATGN